MQRCNFNMDPISISDLLVATGGHAADGLDRDINFNQVVIDSRQVTPGSVFWALPGTLCDGHDFVRDACQRGAAFCVVNSDRNDWGGPVVKVAHTGAALSRFAQWYREQLEPLVIGVTGSVGKTTTREMIHAALSADHCGIRSIANYNNEIGLPLSLFQLEKSHDYGVLEMGACHSGDIRDLCAIAQPEVGVITGIAPVHIEKFGSLEQIIQTKAELLQALPSDGFAVVNGDCPHAQSVAAYANCPVIFVGESQENEYRATNVRASQHQLSFSVREHEYHIPVSGRHHLSAALSAVAVATEVGMTAEQIAEGLLRFTTAAGRCQIKQIGPWTIIDDSYNANPTSMRAACQLMQAWKTGNKKIAVVGDMLELGEEAGRYHHDLGIQIAQSDIDCLLAYGDNAHNVIAGAFEAGMDAHQMAECPMFESLLMNLDCWLEAGDVLLVKGSRTMRMERVVEWATRQTEEINNLDALGVPA